MSYTGKVNVPVAMDKKSKRDLPVIHETTLDFMQYVPVYYRHIVPTEHLVEKISVKSIMAPLAVPTFGRGRINMRAFAVPYPTIMPNWDTFKESSIGRASSNGTYQPLNGLVRKAPFIKNSSFVNMFMNWSTYQPAVGYNLMYAVSDQVNDAYSVEVGNTRYAFTRAGRKALKWLHAIGYRWNWAQKDVTEVNALGILALAKIYCDWYISSAYYDTQALQDIMPLFEYNDPNNPLEITSAILSNIVLLFANVLYDDDVLTSAWDNPVAPNNSSSQLGTFSIYDSTAHGSNNTSDHSIVNYDSASYNQYSTPIIRRTSGAGSSIVQISQYAIDNLKALTDFTRRYALVGCRPCDRFLASFGISLSDEHLRRSSYLGHSSHDFDISPVFSHADTNLNGVSNLGDYAGAGRVDGELTIDYTATDFTMIVVVASVLPSGGYVQGFDRNNLNLSANDFWTPEFDGVGTSPIPKGMVYMPWNDTFYPNGGEQLGIFGWSGMYYQNKISSDLLTGDLELGQFEGNDSWHLFRLFKENQFANGQQDLVHSLSFIRGDDANQYNRIFQDTSTDRDKFTVVFSCQGGSLAPGRHLFDTYEFESDGKEISLPANGVKVN